MAGGQVIKGKEGVQQLLRQMEGNFKIISNEWSLILVQDEKAAASGIPVVEEDAVVVTRFFCNTYLFKNEKLWRMCSYTIKKDAV